MRNKNHWLNSIFSDGTNRFLSNAEPELHDKVTVKVRFWKESPVEKVWIRTTRNGGMELLPAKRMEEDERFVYYGCEFEMTQSQMRYHYFIKATDRMYYYTQAGVTTDPADRKHDFVVSTEYHQPNWIKDAIFYQIFPERFCNGDPSLDVQDGEYQVNGYDTIRIQDWNTPAGTYDQVHCADFYGGDLKGIQQKIPYLKELGINAIYLNPIFRAPSVHKYDCIDYLHVDPHFGGDEALAELMKALHENDMRLILDISINHTGTAHRWFNRDGLYFERSAGAYNNKEAKERAYYMIREDGSYESWDEMGELPKLDFRSEELRQALYKAEDSVIKKWLKPPYCIDGWRFDVADVMANYNEHQLAGEVWPEIRTSIRETNPEGYILAEHWDDCTEYLQGDCWDATMNYYAFGRIIRQFYGSPDPMMEREEEIWPFTTELSAEGFRDRVENYLSCLPYPLWQNQFNLFDSHDIGRFHIYPGMNEEKYRGAVIAMFTMIGIPNVYYGDEASIGGMVGYFEGGRYPMPWDSNFKEGMIYKLHQKLAYLRREHKALTEGSFRFLYAKDHVLAYARFNAEECFITLLSAKENETKIVLPLDVIGVSRLVADVDLLGRDMNYSITGNGELEITLAPEDAYFFQVK